MRRTIKVTLEVYHDLDDMRGKDETFSHVIERLIAIVKPLREMSDILGPSHYLKERPIIDARAKETIDRRPNRPTLPDVPIH